MTTEHDHGEIGVRLIRCTLDAAGIYRSRVLAVRDMRTAQGRDPVSGHGAGNESWIGLALALMVLDTLTPESAPVRARWGRLLTENGIDEDDSHVIYELHCSLLHGYGVPRPVRIGGRRLLLTNVQSAYALDTRDRAAVTLEVGRRDGHAVRLGGCFGKRRAGVRDQRGPEGGAAVWRDSTWGDVADELADVALRSLREKVLGEALVVGEYEDPSALAE